jgi:thioesterase domain-containing protein
VSAGPGSRAPRDGLELALLQIWRQVLAIDDIGIDDNFFDLGGHSLLAVSLVSRCNRRLGVNLPLRVLFERPTIEGMACTLRDPDRPTASSPLVALQPDGFKPPLFCIHPAGGTVFCYMNLAGEMAPDQPVYGLQAAGLEPGETLAASIGDMVDHYLGAIRELQPHGPYHLLGWSFGGLVAHAIACRLRTSGETVALLAMLDSQPPPAGGHIPDDATLMAELANVLAFAGTGEAPTASIASLADLVQVARGSGMFPPDFTAAQTERLLAVYALTVRLGLGHRPDRYDGEVLLFAAGEGGDPDRLARSWAPFIGGGITTVPLACRHERMTAPEAAREIAAALQASIRADIADRDEELAAAK